MSASLLSLHGVSFGYPGRPVVRDADLALFAGERLALLGANGVGKTSLLHLMVGLLRPDGGRVVAFGRECSNEADFREVRARAGLLFQDADDQLFCPTVLEDVAFGPLNLGATRAQAVERARECLAALGMAGFEERITHKLSGGEKRLVSLAAVLAMRPQVLLLDEPSNGLDEQTRERLIEHLVSLPQAMVLVSHDQHLVTRLATRAVLLEQGRVRPAVMHSHPHAHTHAHLHVHAAGHEADHDHETGPIDHDTHRADGPP